MKKGKRLFCGLCTAMLLLALYSFTTNQKQAQDAITGAWMAMEDGNESVLLFADGYATHTVYSKGKKEFKHTRGGPYTVNNGTLSVLLEFDTENFELIGIGLFW